MYLGWQLSEGFSLKYFERLLFTSHCMNRESVNWTSTKACFEREDFRISLYFNSCLLSSPNFYSKLSFICKWNQFGSDSRPIRWKRMKSLCLTTSAQGLALRADSQKISEKISSVHYAYPGLCYPKHSTTTLGDNQNPGSDCQRLS